VSGDVATRGRYPALLGCLVCQMGLGFSYVFTTFLKPIVDDFGWSRTVFAAVGGPLLLSMALASPMIGHLTERWGARRVLSFATLLLGATLVLFSTMQVPWHFYAASLVFGLALTGLGDIPVGAVVSRWFDERRGLALGVVYIGSNIGGAIVPIVATAIAATASWRTALWLLGIGGIALILPFAAFVVRERPPETEALAAGPGAPIHEPGLDLAEALRTRTFWILLVALFVFYFYYIGVLYNLVAFLSDSGFSDPAAALHFSGAVAIGVVGKLAIGLFADRLRKMTALLVTFGLVTLASLLLLRVDSYPVLIAFLSIHGFAVAAENVLLPLIVAESFGVEHMARIYGALMVALLPGGALGPIFAARVYDTLGSYDVAFTTFAALNVASFALLWGVRRERP
jgi:MFS family permease